MARQAGGLGQPVFEHEAVYKLKVMIGGDKGEVT